MRVVMIDNSMGNLGSVSRAFERLGVSLVVTEERAAIEDADVIILPGVGAFGDGIENLKRRGLVSVIQKLVRGEKRPFLGICVGMQLLADEGTEHGSHQGLGLIPGKVVKLEGSPTARVPHMGWSDVTFRAGSILGSGVSPSTSGHSLESFYFANSYHFVPADPSSVAATFEFDGPKVASLEKENVFGIQFHPEKSQESGLLVLRAFLQHVGCLPRVA